MFTNQRNCPVSLMLPKPDTARYIHPLLRRRVDGNFWATPTTRTDSLAGHRSNHSRRARTPPLTKSGLLIYAHLDIAHTSSDFAGRQFIVKSGLKKLLSILSESVVLHDEALCTSFGATED